MGLRYRVVAAAALMVSFIGPLAAQSPDGRTGTLVVLNKSVATATFIDVASGQTVATLPTGQGPHELAMTGDGRWAISTNYGGGNSLTVFDVGRLRVVRTIDLSEYPSPHAAFFLPGDTILAVTSEASRNVVLVRPFTGEIVDTISTGANGSHMVAVTGDGRTLYTSDMRDGTVSRLDVSSRTKTGSFDVPATPEAITVSRDGSQVWVGSNVEGLVSVVDTETGQVDSPLSGFEWPYRILILEERDLVVIPDLGQNVVRFVNYRARSDAGRLDLPGDGPQGLALTADRGTLFLSLSAVGQIAVIDLSSRQIVRRIEAGPTPDGIEWSPLVLQR